MCRVRLTAKLLQLSFSYLQDPIYVPRSPRTPATLISPKGLMSRQI
jgi:hypothetical protein